MLKRTFHRSWLVWDTLGEQLSINKQNQNLYSPWTNRANLFQHTC